MKSRGFTLIELIIVIIILGILAVTAAPRFFDFGGDARSSSVQGLQGAIQGAAQVYYARVAIDGDAAYPSAEDIIEVAQLNSIAFDDDSDPLPGSEWVHETDGDVTTITLRSILTPDEGNTGGEIAATNCYVTYDVTDADENTPPVITAELSGC